ncbi:MAG TPA: flagellar filament capping protein FliD [Candidatus Acidoferrum sp.]|nr:flagellar filament capping protein FliD [Candidatus Acidoferrum sp.]
MATTNPTSGLSLNGSTSLGQGIDVQQFVTLALSGDQANITNLQNTQSILNAQTTALAKITADLNNLQSAVFALNDPLGAVASQTATSSNSNVLGATAASSAVPGVHTVVVTSLATTSSYYSDPVTTSSTPLATGSFQFQVGANGPVTVTVDSTNNTLDGLAAAINNLGAGVRASVITDANGARLALVSETTGASGDITVSNNTTGLNFTKAVTGANAALTVDGVPISSASNSVSNVINGVTLTLVAPAPASPITLTVSPDTTQAADAINKFVAAYNTAIADINAQFNVASDGTGGGPLEADGSLREAQSSLLSAISYSISGNSGIVNLAALGVNLNNDGTLTVDSGALNSALSSNFAGVQTFLQSTTGGFANNLSSVLTNLTDPSAGVLGLDASGISQSSRDLGQQISNLQASLAVRQQQLTQVYAQVNATLQQLPLLQAQLSQQLASA